ncbi:protein of unknown function (plasmid) [Azospirillum baldaniorum]|uniref:Uncharacterized protein n=1 Tax=Azospirillum baldaniorum TaxID=1064539 RepID=A0A9P1NQB3_9PROT|nr:protein of unknown function [Azospirillum baldaniorum]
MTMAPGQHQAPKLQHLRQGMSCDPCDLAFCLCCHDDPGFAMEAHRFALFADLQDHRS